MTSAIRTSRSRLPALLVFFGVPVLLLTAAIVNMLEIGDNEFAAREKEFQLTALMRKLTTPSRDGKPLDLSRIYLPGETATLASAGLQQRLIDAITAASGKIIETSAVDEAGSGEPAENANLAIRASLDIDNDGLLKLLHQLETGLPLIFVEKISVRRSSQDSGDTTTERLRVDLTAAARWKALLQ